MFGLSLSQVCVMIHCGSCGLGHQICSDHVRVMLGAMPHYGITVPDRNWRVHLCPRPKVRRTSVPWGGSQLRPGQPSGSVVGFRRAFEGVIGTGDLALVYDVSHNLAKLEHHRIDGEHRLLCVHRKGATLALPPGHSDLPEDLRAAGQPVLVPGSMGTASHVLVGVDPGGAFSSACHGAGRTISRHAAARRSTVAGCEGSSSPPASP